MSLLSCLLLLDLERKAIKTVNVKNKLSQKKIECKTTHVCSKTEKSRVHNHVLG